MVKNSMDARPPSMRHRSMKDELGHLDPERGAVGGRRPVRRPDEEHGFAVTSRRLGAGRAVGYPLAGVQGIDAVRAVAEKLEAVLAKSSVRVMGPLMSVLKDDPLEVMAPDRNYLVCRAIEGTPPAAEGLEKLRLEGGTFLVLPRVGRIDDLEAEYGFALGQWMPQNRYILAKVQVREVYLHGLEVDDPERVPMELLFPISMQMTRD